MRFITSKYGSRRTEYAGVSYHSKKEANYAQWLDLRVRAHDIKGWERQKRFPLTVNGILIGNYLMDFVIIHNDNHKECVEVKGFQTALFKWKYKHLKAEYPDMTVTIC